MPRRLFYILATLLGLVGFCSLPFIVGLQDILGTLGQVGWFWGVVFVVNSSATLLIPAIGWWILMQADGIPARLITVMKANLMGFPINVATPSMYLGGEPLKIFYIASICQVPKRRVLATVIVSKFQELGALILSLIVGTVLLVWHTDFFTQRYEWLLIVLTVLLGVLCGATLYAFAGHLRPLVQGLRFLGRLGFLHTRMAHLQALAEEVDDRIHTAFTQRVWIFVLAQSVTLLSSVSIFLRPWIFFMTLPEVRVQFSQLCVLFVLTNIVNAFTIIPGALGLFEGTMTGYAAAAGLGDDKGAAFAVISRVADVALVLMGLWLVAHYGLSKFIRRQELERLTAADAPPVSDVSPPHAPDRSADA